MSMTDGKTELEQLGVPKCRMTLVLRKGPKQETSGSNPHCGAEKISLLFVCFFVCLFVCFNPSLS